MEFWFCSIKVITVIGLILVGIIITTGGGPNGETIGFRFWNETGGFVQYSGIRKFCLILNGSGDTDIFFSPAGAKGRFLGFFSGMQTSNITPLALADKRPVLISAAFAFIGTEITAIAAAETANVSLGTFRKGCILICLAATKNCSPCYQERLDQTYTLYDFPPQFVFFG